MRRSRLPSKLRKLRYAARRVADWFPWRPLAFLVGAGAALGLTELAFEQMDLVFLVVGYGAIGLIALTTFFVILGTLIVARHLRKNRLGERTLSLETTQAAPSDFVLPLYTWLPIVQIGWEVEGNEGLEARVEKSAGKRREHLVAEERGYIDGVRRRVVVQDPFGLTRLATRDDDPVRLEVLPHIGALRRLPSLLALAGGEDIPHPMGVADGDRVELRRYAPGDPARFIHWKIFARSRKLMVRMPERALTQTHRTIAYLVAGPGDDASAAAARVALAAGLGEDWSFAADGSGATSDPQEAMRAIVQSVAHRETGGAGLKAFVAAEERRGPASLVLFVPPEPGPWIDKVVAIAKARQGRCRIIVGVDGVDATPEPARWAKLLLRERTADASSLHPLRAVSEALAAARVDVMVFDRRSGRQLSPMHIAPGGAPERKAA